MREQEERSKLRAGGEEEHTEYRAHPAIDRPRVKQTA